MRHRTRTRIGQSLLALTVVSLIVVAAAGAPAAPAAPAGGGAERAAVVKADAPSLPDVLQRVRAAAGDEAWRRGGWTDPVIDTWIEQTLAALAQARPELDLPAPGRLATYAPRDPGEIRPGPVAAGGGEKALVVANRPAQGAVAPPAGPRTKKNAGRGVGAAGIARKWEGERRWRPGTSRPSRRASLAPAFASGGDAITRQGGCTIRPGMGQGRVRGSGSRVRGSGFRTRRTDSVLNPEPRTPTTEPKS